MSHDLLVQLTYSFNSGCFFEIYIYFSKTTDFFSSPPKCRFPDKRRNSLTDRILNNMESDLENCAYPWKHPGDTPAVRGFRALLKRWLTMSLFVNLDSNRTTSLTRTGSTRTTFTKRQSGTVALLERWLTISLFGSNSIISLTRTGSVRTTFTKRRSGSVALLERWLAISFLVNLETHVWFATFCQWTLGSNRSISLQRTRRKVWKERKSLKTLYETLKITTFELQGLK